MNLDLSTLAQRLKNAQRRVEDLPGGQPRAGAGRQAGRRVTPAQRAAYLRDREQARQRYGEQIRKAVDQELQP